MFNINHKFFDCFNMWIYFVTSNFNVFLFIILIFLALHVWYVIMSCCPLPNFFSTDLLIVTSIYPKFFCVGFFGRFICYFRCYFRCNSLYIFLQLFIFAILFFLSHAFCVTYEFYRSAQLALFKPFYQYKKTDIFI